MGADHRRKQHNFSIRFRQSRSSSLLLPAALHHRAPRCESVLRLISEALYGIVSPDEHFLLVSNAVDLRALIAFSVAMVLEGRAAIRRWRLLCGPTDSNFARRVGKWTLRARFGTDSTRNAVVSLVLRCCLMLESIEGWPAAQRGTPATWRRQDTCRGAAGWNTRVVVIRKRAAVMIGYAPPKSSH